MTTSCQFLSYRVSTEALCKLIGSCLLLGSFVFTGWILSNAAGAIDHMLDDLFALFHDSPPLFEHHDVSLLNG
jgi:hypothetical protein